ncbi:MAG: serine/threonine-protein kinase, partial [Ardenticatenaceae bacterium]
VLGRFQREAQIIGSLNHHAIVPIYEFGWENGEPFIVMPLMSGGGLDERLELGPLPLDEIVRILSWLAPALDTVHQRGIVHRDLKPANILFNEHNAPYIADFGIATLNEETMRFSKIGMPIGTPAYMSPQQGVGDGNLDGRSDIYSLGAMLFEMLTGKPPYHQAHWHYVVYMHIHEPVPRLDELRTDLSADYQAIIDCAMAKNPEQRYPTASEMVAALKAVMVGTTTSRQPRPKPSQPQTP